MRLVLTGVVQGVGFRPFVYRLAQAHGIVGWVRNELGQVTLHIQGQADNITDFKTDLLTQAPPLARPVIQSCLPAEALALDHFAIKPSGTQSPATIHVPADYYLCHDCRRELFDPANRRYRYPFINCTHCGPRYTLITRLPYDRANTGMAEFTLCPACRAEYDNPADRRFHAEPIACPACGPQLQYYAADVGLVAETSAALASCSDALRAGKIVAVKGIGGYHLLCDARNDTAVQTLRQRKPRPHKPLAVMFPVKGDDELDAIRAMTDLDPVSAAQLRDPLRPIVLVRKGAGDVLSPQLAPDLNEIGVFLPYSPLHALLLHDFQGPLVATSANISGEPVLTNNQDVERRLAHVADAFLHHNRPIERPADDSVYRVIANAARPLRLGRGVAPLELSLPVAIAKPTLAVGGHMKNTIALAWDDRIVVSPHIGDLDAPRSLEVFEQVIADLQTLYRVKAQRLICDAHPAYASTRWASQDGREVCEVFHHHAHASAIAGEYSHEPRWLVFTWDGTGYGADGTIWGGETFYGVAADWQRVASLRPFNLPGGDKAGREPWRAALALCWETGQRWQSPLADSEILYKAWQQKLNSPQSTSMGRLFDAAAALIDVCTQASFEGQAPMALEAMASRYSDAEGIELPMTVDQQGVWRSDWAALLPMLLDPRRSREQRAAMFHASLAKHILRQCEHFRQHYAEFAVGLGGGVFQNRLLAEMTLDVLSHAGFRVYLPGTVPCNDGGLCFGQIIEQAYRDAKETQSI
ncbi:MAG: carbamoyltransferase HypF [Gammaproteobacteria bacterium]|nr:carbamoyltransferase HypF [Gammaproteobacteria bacterium]